MSEAAARAVLGALVGAFSPRAPEDSLFNAEYPMVRWLEQDGYGVSYFTGVDSDRHGTEIREHRAFLSVGHDEYWSGAQRTNVEAARDAGVHPEDTGVHYRVTWPGIATTRVRLTLKVRPAPR